MSNNGNTTKTEKKFNPSLGGAFTNDKFGEGAIKLDITEENYDTLMKNVRVGSSIVLKFNKVTSKGNKHYFTEVLPPYVRPEGAGTKAKSSSDLD